MRDLFQFSLFVKYRFCLIDFKAFDVVVISRCMIQVEEFLFTFLGWGGCVPCNPSDGRPEFQDTLTGYHGLIDGLA